MKERGMFSLRAYIALDCDAEASFVPNPTE